MQEDLNTCNRCGQTLNLVEETLADYQVIRDRNNKQLCLRCYQDYCDYKV